MTISVSLSTPEERANPLHNLDSLLDTLKGDIDEIDAAIESLQKIRKDKEQLIKHAKLGI